MIKKAFARITTGVFLISLGNISCSHNPADFESDEIAALVYENKVTIINNIQHPIYFQAFELETSWAISWAPISRDKNKINSRQNKKLNLNDVLGFKEGKQIIIYYWSSKDPDAESIKNIVVKT